MKWISASSTSAGGRRANEDYCCGMESGSFGCWAVADGLGGHEGGEVASRLAAELVVRSAAIEPELSAARMRELLGFAHDDLRREQQRRQLPDMRTTIAVLCREGDAAIWAHVGDTRLYYLSGGTIAWQTKDHSVCQTLVNIGEITMQDIRFHEDRSRLLRVVGMEGAYRPEVLAEPQTARAGDAFLLCSDGWWEYVTETEMEIDWAKSTTPSQWLAAMEDRLLRRAKDGHDNYTAIAVFVAE